MKVIYGILLSTFLGFGMGWLTARLIARLCRRAPRNKANQVFHWGQIIAGAGVAFMHGAQDGQKFMSIFMLGIALTAGLGQPAELALPVWLMVLCAVNMGLGTAIGEDHQKRRHEHGETRGLPRLRGKPFCHAVPHAGHVYRHAGFYHACEDYGHYGRGGGQTKKRREVAGCH